MPISSVVRNTKPILLLSLLLTSTHPALAQFSPEERALVLQKAEKQAERIPAAFLKAQGIARIAQGYYRAGLAAKGRELFEKARSTAQSEADPALRKEALLSILYERVEFLNTNSAIQEALALPEESQRDSALLAFAENMKARRPHRETLRVLNLIKERTFPNRIAALDWQFWRRYIECAVDIKADKLAREVAAHVPAASKNESQLGAVAYCEYQRKRLDEFRVTAPQYLAALPVVYSINERSAEYDKGVYAKFYAELGDFQNARSLSKTLTFDYGRVRSLLEVASHCVTRRNYAEAKHTIQEVQEMPLTDSEKTEGTPSRLELIARLQARMNDTTALNGTLSSAKEGNTRSFLLLAAAEEATKLRRSKQGKAWVEQSLGALVAEDSKSRYLLHDDIQTRSFLVYLALGEPEKAEALFARLKQPYNMFKMQIAVAYHKKGNLARYESLRNQALQGIQQSQRDESIKLAELSAFAEDCLEVSDFESAKAIVTSLPIESATYMLYAIAQKRNREGDMEQAKSDLTLAESLAAQVKQRQYRNSSLMAVSIWQSDIGDFEGAVQTAEKMDKPLEQVTALVEVSKMMVPAEKRVRPQPY